MKYYSHSEAETESIAKDLASTLRRGDVLALSGYLGAGKTAFTRGLARGLGITDMVTSPTFTIVNEYSGDIPLFHFDMYRLSSEEELFELGWDDYLDRGGIVVVEWSENIPEAFEKNTIRVDIEKTGETERVITIELPEDRQ